LSAIEIKGFTASCLIAMEGFIAPKTCGFPKNVLTPVSAKCGQVPSPTSSLKCGKIYFLLNSLPQISSYKVCHRWCIFFLFKERISQKWPKSK